MVTAAWVEAQHLNASNEQHRMQVRNFHPSSDDYRVLKQGQVR
jgi:hypothetical protein